MHGGSRSARTRAPSSHHYPSAGPAAGVAFTATAPCRVFVSAPGNLTERYPVRYRRPRRHNAGRPRPATMRAASDDIAIPSSTPPPPPSSSSANVGGNGTTLDVANEAKASRFKVQRRIATGIVMGAVVIGFVFSGRVPFLLSMLAVSLLGQNEYYRMVIAKGHLPAYKSGLCVTALTMICSALSPNWADIVFPLGGTFMCIYLLFRRKSIATIADISTTFMGLFYAGYMPSFWVRLHNAPIAPSVLALPQLPSTVRFNLLWPVITGGALVVFWTWLAAVSSDVGAFFFGRSYGKTRLTHISPKKTVEGALAGIACSGAVSLCGAYLMQWPLWYVTGAAYGVLVGILGLSGDLFESCFKRDVGWKDSGSLFPGHGGILDRADTYVLQAPLVYFFVTLVLPLIAARVG